MTNFLCIVIFFSCIACCAGAGFASYITHGALISTSIQLRCTEVMNPSTTTPTAPYFPPPPRYASTTKKSKAKDVSRTSTDASPKRPFILRRSRQFLLPSLLILSFVNTILSMIYAYCIAAPHTRLSKEDFANGQDTEVDDSFFKRAVGLVPRGSAYGSDDGTPNFAMVAYTLSAPLATLVYIIVELSMHVVRPHISITRRAHKVFLFFVAVLAAGWTTNNALWTHCEMPAPSLTANMRMCPASVRGHFMFGIHELSIAKVIVGWFIVIGLLVHMFCIVKNMRDIRRYGGDGLGIQHGSVRMVLEMEEGSRVQRTLRRSYKRHGVRIAEGY